MSTYMEQENHGNLTQFTISLSLKKAITKLLLSISLFSFIVSYSSCCNLFLHYVKFYLVAFPWQLLSHALDKSYIFLICNGILVFIAKTSFLVQYSPHGNDLNDILERKIVDDLQTSSKIEDFLLEKGNVLEGATPQEANVEELKGEKVEYQKIIVKNNGIEPQNEFFNVDGDDGGVEENEKENETYILGGNDHGEKDFSNGFCMAAETEEDMELLSTEELNKKFEDFIRRMKEDLRIEAQQQLVMDK